MDTVITISCYLFLLAGTLFFAFGADRNRKNRRMELRLEENSKSIAKREEACREAMRRNGAARLEIDKKVGDFNIEHKLVTVNYVETDEDVEKYPSQAKRLAVIKSRLAHNIGYGMIAEFPDPDIWTDDDGARVFSYRFLVKKEK
jgi:hypothetical protein